MPTLPQGAVMLFTSYEVGPAPYTFLNFVCQNPPGGYPTDYEIALTDDELAAATTIPQLKTLITTKLQRRYQAVGVSTKLDPFIGQSITI
jgi:hypothetical protein